MKDLGKLSDDQIEELREAARFMSRGNLGGFAAYIGDAMLHADNVNLDRLRLAFPELVQAAWDRIEIINANQ